MEPKYVLLFDATMPDTPFVIKEQSVMTLEGKPQLFQKSVYRCDTFEAGLKFLSNLSNGQYIALACSTITIDNTFVL
jgi:hypothetical protein